MDEDRGGNLTSHSGECGISNGGMKTLFIGRLGLANVWLALSSGHGRRIWIVGDNNNVTMIQCGESISM